MHVIARVRMQLRKLLATFKKKRDEGDEDPKLLQNLRREYFPHLPEINASTDSGVLKENLKILSEKREQLEGIKRKLQALTEAKQAAEQLEGGRIEEDEA
jgi:uncharacterized coiled-coil protein SlyX